MTAWSSLNRVLSALGISVQSFDLTGPQIARARRSYGLTSIELAKRADISVGCLLALENGRDATDRLVKLNKALIDYVLSRGRS